MKINETKKESFLLEQKYEEQRKTGIYLKKCLLTLLGHTIIALSFYIPQNDNLRTTKRSVGKFATFMCQPNLRSRFLNYSFTAMPFLKCGLPYLHFFENFGFIS